MLIGVLGFSVFCRGSKLGERDKLGNYLDFTAKDFSMGIQAWIRLVLGVSIRGSFLMVGSASCIGSSFFLVFTKVAKGLRLYQRGIFLIYE